MSIRHNPQPPKEDFVWRFILWPRQIGEWRVCCEWVRLRKERGGNTITTEWRNKNGILLYRETETASAR